MTAPQWFLIGCFAVFAVVSRVLINRAFPREGAGGLAEGRGDEPRAVLYSLTGAMMPWKKETANRHIVSYALGLGLHAGIFLAFFLLIILFLDVGLPGVVEKASMFLLLLGAASGVVLLIKRAVNAATRYLSNPDDYFSNLIVTGFLLLTALAQQVEGVKPFLFIYAGALLLYIPLSKLRHALYFGLARTYLGLFYGRRGVWPARGRKSWRTRS